jgi:hypothetical protein
MKPDKEAAPEWVTVKRASVTALFDSLDHIEGGMPAVVEDAASALSSEVDAAHTGERIAALEAEVAMLRGALLTMGRMIPGVILDDRVSSQFLSQLPEELAHYSLARTALAGEQG